MVFWIKIKKISSTRHRSTLSKSVSNLGVILASRACCLIASSGALRTLRFYNIKKQCLLFHLMSGHSDHEGYRKYACYYLHSNRASTTVLQCILFSAG